MLQPTTMAVEPVQFAIESVEQQNGMHPPAKMRVVPGQGPQALPHLVPAEQLAEAQRRIQELQAEVQVLQRTNANMVLSLTLHSRMNAVPAASSPRAADAEVMDMRTQVKTLDEQLRSADRLSLRHPIEAFERLSQRATRGHHVEVIGPVQLTAPLERLRVHRSGLLVHRQLYVRVASHVH